MLALASRLASTHRLFKLQPQHNHSIASTFENHGTTVKEPPYLLLFQTTFHHQQMAEQKEVMEAEVIHSWSAPRSLSTSLMYSFAQVAWIALIYLFIIILW
jgi:hypothetical protein